MMMNAIYMSSFATMIAYSIEYDSLISRKEYGIAIWFVKSPGYRVILLVLGIN